MLNWTIRSDYQAEQNPSEFSEMVSSYNKVLNSEEVGFFRLPQNQNLINESQKIYQEFKHKKYFIHVGIGGSALGPEMLLKALGKKTGAKFCFVNNIDPDELKQKLEDFDLKEALIYVVSKSGTTAETVAAMSILISELKKLGITEDQFKNYFVFCTDPEKGDLRKLSLDWNIKCLSVPANVGGRYSILTPVGFLPAFFAGINVTEILDGATQIQKKLSDPHLGKSFFNLGYWIKHLHDQGFSQTVLMPYSSLLKEFSFWYVQLWAESLGKEGKGLTPIPAYGATDQHSQMQLFMEGPKDKVLFVIEIEEFNHVYSLENHIDANSFKNLAHYSLNQLMKAELEGTLEALKQNNRPVVHIKIPKLNEASLGQLILFSESLTLLVGQLFRVDPFNQPGVEAGKKYAYAWLKSGRF